MLIERAHNLYPPLLFEGVEYCRNFLVVLHPVQVSQEEGSEDPLYPNTKPKTSRKFRQHSIIVTVGTHSLSVKEQNE